MVTYRKRQEAKDKTDAYMAKNDLEAAQHTAKQTIFISEEIEKNIVKVREFICCS